MPVDNPFKPQPVPWVRYFLQIALALLVTLTLVWWDQRRSSNETPSLHLKTNHHHKKKDPSQQYPHNLKPNIQYDPTTPFPKLNGPDEFAAWWRHYYLQLDWSLVQRDIDRQHDRSVLTQDVVTASLALGCGCLRANQKEPEGNFNYQYNFVTQTLDAQDNQVRNVGALWGLALCHQHVVLTAPNDPMVQNLQRGIELALDFFLQTLQPAADQGKLLVNYPKSRGVSSTGTNAILALALIDYMRSLQAMQQHDVQQGRDGLEHEERYQKLEPTLQGLIQYLVSLQMDDLHFSKEFYIDRGGKKSLGSSGYFDGETLLALTKAAKYIPGYAASLVPLIERTAPVLAHDYTVGAWHKEIRHDSDTTKGFYQWSSMALTEYYQTKYNDDPWNNVELMGDYVLGMAHWIIHTHQILTRRRNTGYAYEGIISAYMVAQDRNNVQLSNLLRRVTQMGLYSLTTWQVGGPLAHQNPYLVEHPPAMVKDTNGEQIPDPLAVGGVMNAVDEAPLRIDTTQHQMHALMMALEQKMYGTTSTR